MSHHYKRYSLNQLQEEENDLKERLAEAENLDQRNYIAVYKRKIEIVQSDMLDQDQFHAGGLCEYMENRNYLFKNDDWSRLIPWYYRIARNSHGRIDICNLVTRLLIFSG